MAMLLSRLKERIAKSNVGRLQCIATSATLGSENAFPAIAHFAKALFGESFEWEPPQTSRQDVVMAIRKPMAPLANLHSTAEPRAYTELLALLDGKAAVELKELAEVCISLGFPPNATIQACDETAQGDTPRFLYLILQSDGRLARVRAALVDKPRLLDDLAVEVFGLTPDARANLVALIELANRARLADDSLPLLPVRYHLFVRAIEGAYVSFKPTKRLYLDRLEEITVDEQQNMVFELATCRQCGAVYLVGESQTVNGLVYFRQPGNQYFEDPKNLETYLLVPDDFHPLEEDEDDVDPTEKTEALPDQYRLCTKCGAIEKTSYLQPPCQCDRDKYVLLEKVRTTQGRVNTCPACQSSSTIELVRRFLAGIDATASVLTSALYQKIPCDMSSQSNHSQQVTGRWAESKSVQTKHLARAVVEPRKLLVFSDNRQDAAFFAPYLERTYTQIIRRRLILKVLSNNRDRALANSWRVADLVAPLIAAASNAGLFLTESLEEKETEVWKWILYELMAFDRRHSLESLGLLGFTLVLPQDWEPLPELSTLGYSYEKAKTLYQVLLKSFRMQGALIFPDSVNPQDSFFAPRNRLCYFSLKRPEGSKNVNVLGWTPTRSSGMNSRLDYLERVTLRCSGDRGKNDQAREILEKIWREDLTNPDMADIWEGYFQHNKPVNGSLGFHLQPRFWELQPGFINPALTWYICDTCQRITLHNIRGVCPTYQCSGVLHRCEPQLVYADDHYRRVYTDPEVLPLVAEEHTAQLTSVRAAELQGQFIKGKVNVLSCSTTFELGVDVGDLEAVFMRNVPPTAANYIQRAGRAGRRSSATAFALTFAQRRPHDLSHFNEPERMISGQIKPPYFTVANDKVVRRHIYATALAPFWRENKDTFQKVQSFFFRTGETGPAMLERYLASKPQHLWQSIKTIVPQELQASLQVDSWGWVAGLLDPSIGVLSIANGIVTNDVMQLERKRQELFSAGRNSDYINRILNTIKDEYLITFLSRHNVLPKYGFPVDVVELQLLHHSDEASALELSRDLRIALSEYAPSSQIVAGGYLWTSRYIKRFPDRQWRRYHYAICGHCQRYQSLQAEPNLAITHCTSCGQPVPLKNRGDFIIPQFGFMSEYSTKLDKPGEARPEKTYTTRTYFNGKSTERKTIELPLRGITVTAAAATDGELAVINHANHRHFKICNMCGYAVRGEETYQVPHQTPWGSECRNKYGLVDLGHEFTTDILQIRFEGYSDINNGFWLSLLYALLEGTTHALDIERQDIDGVLYRYQSDNARPMLVLFDDVPGGAGHVRRIADSANQLKQVLSTTLDMLGLCTCGGETGDASCYGCLRNYKNQFCHNDLKRGPVIRFLTSLLS
ncbi:MAG: DUF1998 domain-containing protein [Chloroflexi bacterium]|nr:DUF1998 domain-containing protein [Chloroflexota bacterium]